MTVLSANSTGGGGAAAVHSDVESMRGIVSPAIQWPAEPLKSQISRTPVPIPNEPSLVLSAAVAAGNGATVVTNEFGQPAGGPWAIQRAFRDVRESVAGRPSGFRFHDLRHSFASLLIADGLDVKTVQIRLRLDVYGHMRPDQREASRAAVAAAIAARREILADFLRTKR